MALSDRDAIVSRMNYAQLDEAVRQSRALSGQ
jgi:hypothetical protein